MDNGVTFTLNGLPAECKANSSVLDIIQSRALSAQTVVVMLNGEVLKAEDFAVRNVDQSAEIEIMHFVGGG